MTSEASQATERGVRPTERVVRPLPLVCGELDGLPERPSFIGAIEGWRPTLRSPQLPLTSRSLVTSLPESLVEATDRVVRPLH